MLKEKQLVEIREKLENCLNPFFFFDNDPDGLASFILLRKYCGKGKGAAIKSSYSLTKSYFKHVEKNNSDCIFVLDKPVIDEDFIKLAEEKNLSIVHIDHHVVEKNKVENFYNPREVSGTNEPVSDICFRITKRKEDLWLACVGCVSDAFIPDFIKELEKKDKEIINTKYKTAFDILYKTKLGEIIKIFSFALRDSEKNVDALVNFLINCNNYQDFLDENDKTKSFLHRARIINEKYNKLLEKAKEYSKEKILFFGYSGEIGLNRDLSNELMYLYPEKLVVVAFIKSGKANISLRWAKGDIRKIGLAAIRNIEGATGGGHENSIGVQLAADDVQLFRENLLKEIEKL